MKESIAKLMVLILLGILLSYFCRYIATPFIGVFLIWFIVSLLISIKVSNKYSRIISIIVTVCLFTLLVSEIYYWNLQTDKSTVVVQQAQKVQKKPVFSYRTVGKKYDNVPHDIYGYAPRKNTSRKVTFYRGDEVIYDVKYTIDKNGLRISPSPKSHDSPSILFFGDSFTYGEGVTDEETMPYLTGIITNRKYNIYNFGISAHGPQLMLAQLEFGIVDKVVKQKPIFVIYQVIPDNIIRQKALRGWLVNGPHYILNEKGEAEFSLARKWLVKINIKLERSYLYRKLFDTGVDVININKQFITNIKKGDDHSWGEDKNRIEIGHIKLLAAIVDKSRNILKVNYPEIKFHVIYWDEDDEGLSDTVIEELSNKGITTHRIRDIIPDYSYEKYNIKFDGHPSPLAHQIIADYVVKEIIRE